MNIIHIKFTNLANAPDDLNSNIRQYAIKYPNSNITTSLIYEPNPQESYNKVVRSLHLGKLNILHFHNLSYNIDPRLYEVYKIKQIIQYHSEPIGNKAMLSSPIRNKFVIAQYHMTLLEYQNCKVVRNLIDLTRPAYNYEYSIKDDIVRVGFSPSVLDRRNHYYDKGAQETFNIFQMLKQKYPTKFDFDLIHNVEYNECLIRKAKCDIVNAAKYCQKKKMNLITLSGFNKNNPLSKLGLVNFYINSKNYNFIEMSHHIILLSIVDIFANKKN